MAKTAISLLIAAVFLLAAPFAGTAAAESSASESNCEAARSIAVGYDETEFQCLTAGSDGSVTAERSSDVGNRRQYTLESFLADGSADIVARRPVGPTKTSTFPAAGGKTLVLRGTRLTRRRADGGLDRSFGRGGRVKLPVGSAAVVELASGRILVVTYSDGIAKVLPKERVSAEILERNGRGSGTGRLTPLFTRALPFHTGTAVVAIEPAPRGGAFLAGGGGGEFSGYLLEVGADGRPRRGFGDDGLVTGLPRLAGARLLDDGSVEAIGSRAGGIPAPDDLLVSRYDRAGRPLKGFGVDGTRHFDFGGIEEVGAVLWGEDGSAVVGGNSRPRGSCEESSPCDEEPIVVALDAAGELDQEFGDDGLLRLTPLKATSENGFCACGVLALARRPDGTIVAAGGAGPNGTVAFLAAFGADGALLPAFGEAGIVRVALPAPEA